MKGGGRGERERGLGVHKCTMDTYVFINTYLPISKLKRNYAQEAKDERDSLGQVQDTGQLPENSK